MGAPGYFGQHAERLTTAGYEVIPITRPDDPVKDAGKQPAQPKGWQNGCPRDQWHQYADRGLGILCRTTPALDIDVLHPELAQAIQDLADHHLGDAPVRFGQAPKRLMPYQLKGEQFKKLRVEWRKGPAVHLHPENKPPAVELLTNTQFVALGIHPTTKRPYEWHRDPGLSLPHSLLPFLDQERAVRFMRMVATALERIGATDVKLTGIPEPETVTVDDVVSGKWRKRDNHGERPLADRIEDALARIGNPEMHYDDWIRIGHAIKRELPGADGQRIWESWSAEAKKNDPQLTRKKWGTLTPHTISPGTIFHLAREAGR